MRPSPISAVAAPISESAPQSIVWPMRERMTAWRPGAVLTVLVFAGVAALPVAAAAAEKVDLLLVLAADVSRSVDAAKFQLQRDGYAAAISDPRVLDAIRSGRNGRIAVTFV